MKKFLLTQLWVFVSIITFAQIPSGYYDSADGEIGYSLKTALHNIIDDHTDQGYSALWTLYYTSDERADGKVWDMYSDCDLTFGTDQDNGSGGTTECDKYNREHSFPKSWFNDGSPMINDPFHVVPTDKKVNSERGSLAYGEVSSASYTSLNGSKVGSNSLAGYTGTVFEPIDEYKGDFARGYFYMATRYEDVVAGWENHASGGDAMLDGSSDQVFEIWALDMLISWHELDPVSQKEIDRNDAIYDYQGNRNPFIDHPEWVGCIWENECSTSSSPTITITESLTDLGTVAFGNSSTAQSYTVEGTDLTEDITITASSDFEVALTDNDADFGSSITLTESTGSVSSTTVFVRFTPASDANTSVNGTLTHSSTGATDEVINVSGTEETAAGTPAIIVSESSFDFGEISFGNSSTAQSYTIEGSDLTEDISITASESFEISLDDVDANYTDNLTINQSGGEVSSTTIFARFKPSSDTNGQVTGNITHTSSGATNQVIEVIGTEEDTSLPVVSFSGNSIVIDPSDSYTVFVKTDKAVSEDLTINLEIVNATNIEYSTNGFTTQPEENNESINLSLLAGETTTSFQINFGSDINSTVTKAIEFGLLSDANYTIGSNSSFEITINPGEKDGTVTSLPKDVNSSEPLVHPNPVSGTLFINGNENITQVKIYNLRGEKVYQSKVKSSVDVSGFQKGIYYILLFENSVAKAHKFIVD